MIMIIINFQGHVTDLSAKMEALTGTHSNGVVIVFFPIFEPKNRQRSVRYFSDLGRRPVRIYCFHFFF